MTRKGKVEKTETIKSKQPKADQYTITEMVDALTKTRGMKTLAAKQLGCAYNTIVSYMEKYPEVAQAAVDAHENMLDAVELKLFERCMQNDITAIIFTLKTQGRKRGYIEKQEQEHSGGLKIEIVEVDAKNATNPS